MQTTKNTSILKNLKKLSLTAFALALCALLYSCDDNQQVTNPNFETMTGKFLNQNGKPVKGITVEATDANGKVFSTDITDADGFFKIQNLPTELTNGIVSFVNDGEIIHQEKLENFVNTYNATNEKVSNIFQSGNNDCDAVFKLTLKDAETEQPILNAEVRLATSQNAAFNKTSDVQGNVFFENIAPGKYYLRVAQTDYQVYEDAFVLLFPEGTDTLRYSIYLNKKIDNGNGGNNQEGICCTNSVRFYVIDATTNQKVRLQDIDGADIRCATRWNTYGNLILHDDGLVEFNGLCADTLHIHGGVPGYNMQYFPLYRYIKVECGDNLLLEPFYIDKIGAPCGGSIKFTVVDELGKPVVGVWVDIAGPAGGYTDENGVVKLTNDMYPMPMLVTKNYWVSVSYNLGVNNNVELEIVKGDTTFFWKCNDNYEGTLVIKK